MPTPRQPHSTRPSRRARTRIAALALLALATAALALPGTAAPAGAAGGGGALATVGNGITTTDLAAVGMSPTSLASALVGTGVSVSNVTYAGADAQAGLIHVVDPAVVSFNDGIILSSGNIADVVGPNKSDGITGDMAGPADADLNALIADTQTVNPVTFDRASLEFDFVPTASTVYFTYTFGSDEYLEWVNLFNDVFAFYVNGQNCATVPSGAPVTIDTINDAVNPNLFRDNAYWTPPANPINIESDGLSVEMICQASVNPGVTNHMKLAIADTSDQILDSVVMIKAQSLSTTKPESCNDHVDNDDDAQIDDADTDCSSTTTPPPVGSEGIGSGGNAPPFTGNEGTPIPLDASALDWTATPDTISTTWTVDGINGTTGSCEVTPNTPQPVGPLGAIAVVTAICPNEGEYVARVDGLDNEGSSSFDKDVDFFVHNAPPSVSIDTPAPGGEATVGATASLAATVTDPGSADTVGCEISWGDGTTEPGTLAGGSCSGDHVYADTGAKLISVTATDDAGDSSATATVLTVNTAPVTDTTLASSANPSVKGQSVSLTGSTTLGTTGTMSFYDGATLLGTKTVSGGSATLMTSKLAVGNHPITVAYKATSTSTPSVSDVLDQQVDRALTTTTLTSNANPSVAGQQIGLRASVVTQAPGTGAPTGTVEFYEGATLIGTRTVSSGGATLSLRPTVGSHTYSARYLGSATHTDSATVTPLGQQVDQAATTTTLTSTVNPSVFGQSAGLKVAVKADAPGSGTPTGTVDIYEGTTLIASRALVSGKASLTVKPTVGPHSYTATYSGDASYLASSTATALDQVVAPANTAVTVTSSFPVTYFGHAGNITATVKAVAPGAGIPTGTVTFIDNGTPIATVATASTGKAVIPIASLAPGVHELTATYSGNANFLASATLVPFSTTIT